MKVVLIILSFIIIITLYNCDAKKEDDIIFNYNDDDDYYMEKDSSNPLDQLFKGKDESPQSFVRLVLMRLIYGLASQFGYEERLSGLFNGAFVPPNADDGIGIFGGDYDDGGGLLDIFDL